MPRYLIAETDETTEVITITNATLINAKIYIEKSKDPFMLIRKKENYMILREFFGSNMFPSCKWYSNLQLKTEQIKRIVKNDQ